MFNISFLDCTKAELWDLSVCIEVNGEKFQSLAMTLTMVPQGYDQLNSCHLMTNK